MSELPTGTVTLLLGDIEDSTTLWERRPDEMRSAVAELDQLIAKAVAAHGGGRPVEQGEGDSFVAGFARASGAVACALALQRATLPAGLLRLRMGIHTGEVELRGAGNYMGRTINRAARLRDAGHGGQVLLSQATAELARDVLPGEASVRELGALELRGFDGGERTWQLVHPDLPFDFPPLRGLDTTRTNLPVQLTSFVGRVDDVEVVGGLLDEARCVTLTGSGGAGKTRLALEVARRRIDGHPDGVWFVDLSRYNEIEAAIAGMAEAVGYRRAKGASIDAIADHLADRSVLVVLDNCEHLISLAAHVGDALLRRCPRLAVLATSREPLGVAGEVTFRVPSLALPDSDDPLDAVAESDGVALFVDRARRAQPAFVLDGGTASVVGEICRRLDGLPLAIELAAARLRALTPVQILDGLHDRFRLLTGGARTTIARQQTLHASVDWSYALLLEPERAVLNRLSVFAGGFTLEAAEVVCAGGEVEAHHVLDIVLHLVDKSLVNTDGDRLHLLETVRQYAAARLVDSGEAAATRAGHYTAFSELARRHPPFGATEAAYREAINGDYENTRRALQWAADQPDRALLARLADSLNRYWTTGTRMSEGARWYQAVADRTDDLVEKGTALSRLGLLTFLCGTGAADVTEEALDLLRASGDRGSLVEALVSAAATTPSDAILDELESMSDSMQHHWLRGWAAYSRGVWTLRDDVDGATKQLEEARRIARQAGDAWLDQSAQLMLAFRHTAYSDLGTALAAMEECIDASRTAGGGTLLANALMFAAMLRQNMGDREGADGALRELEALGDEAQLAEGGWQPVLMGRAFLAASRGEWDASIAYLTNWTEVAPAPKMAFRVLAVIEALTGKRAAALRHNDEATQTGGRELIPVFPADLTPAISARDGGDWAAAEEAARAAVAELRTQTISVLMYHVVVLVLASIWAGRGRHEEAVRLFAATRADGERQGLVWDNAMLAAAEAGQVEACRAVLGDELFETMWAEGAAMTWDDALAYALRGWGPRDRPAYGWDALTPTERQVADLVASGVTNRETAEKLFMSVATVKTHLTRIYSKLGITSRVGLANVRR